MKNVSLAVPSLGNFAPASAPPFDIRSIDPSALLTKLSMDLLPSDQLTIFGTLDITATPFSPNNVLLGSVQGNNGSPGNGAFLSYWPFLFIQRVAGKTPTSPTSLFYACSATAMGTPATPPSVALPRLNANPGSTVAAAGPMTAIDLPQTTAASASTTIAAGSNGVLLPTPTLLVASTTGFAASGTIFIPAIFAYVTYTSITGGATPSFNGCTTTSVNLLATGQSVIQAQVLPQGTINVASTTGFASPAGSLFIPAINAIVNYTNTTATSFTGCTTTSTAALTNQIVIQNESLPQGTIDVASTAGFAPTGSIYIVEIDALIAYTSIVGNSFAGCTTTSTATLGQGQTVVQAVILPQTTVDVASTIGFTPTGSFIVPASGAVVAYRGLTPTSFTECTTSSTAALIPGQAINQVVTSALLNLGPFGNPVRVGLDANQTIIDTFQLYGTDDPDVASTAGGTILASLQGGGAASSNKLVSAYQYVYAIRTGGFTAGNLLAWGANDTASGSDNQGPINLGSLAVGDTPSNGQLGPNPGLTAAQSVDLYSSFVLTQTTGGGINVVFPDPTNTEAGKILFVSVSPSSAQGVMLYGASVGTGTGIVLQWAGTAWTPL